MDGIERTELLARASKAIINQGGFASHYSGSSRSNDFSIEPDANLKRVLEVVQQDPVVRGAVTTLVNRSLEPGYSFYGKDKKSRRQDAVDKMGELRFDDLAQPLFQHLFTYRNAFIEIVRLDDGTPVELHMLDPRYIEPHVDKHGAILYYVMQVGGEVVYWRPEEVTHIKTSPLSQNVWGDVDTKALWTSVALKYHVKKLLLWLYETNQFRPLLNIQDATDDQIKRFLTFLDQARSDIKKLVPIEGKVEAIYLTNQIDYSQLKELLTYLDFEILSLLQVPPIAVGLPDNANRSNSDAQERALNTHIRAMQRIVENAVSKDLLPKLGFDKVTLKFNVIDHAAMVKTLEMAERMRNMGFKEDLIKDFLEKEGWDFPAGTIFDVAALPKKSDDMFESRKGKLPGEASEKVGTGEQATTREDQLVARTQPRWTYDFLVDE